MPVAHKGDADLEFDVTTTLSSVVCLDGDDLTELVITGEGGLGGWSQLGGPLQDVTQVDNVSIVCGFRVTSTPTVAADVAKNVRRLTAWGAQQAMVRIVSAPGKLSTVYGPDGLEVFLPRS